jgi:hypothetical protein
MWLVIGLQSTQASGEVVVAQLKTVTADFTNVRIFNRTSTHLSFAHENGTAVIKLTDIDADSLAAIERAQAGLPEPVPATGELAAVEGLVVTNPVTPKGDLRVAAFSKAFADQLNARTSALGITRQMIWGVLAGMVLLYLFYCYCCSLICDKAGVPGGLLVWIPVFQIIPLFRAAGMSGWWFLAMFVPVLNLIGQVLWCVKIAQARNKGFVTAVFLILPVTNILAFLYLAFSNGHNREDDSFAPVRPPHALAVN